MENPFFHNFFKIMSMHAVGTILDSDVLVLTMNEEEDGPILVVNWDLADVEDLETTGKCSQCGAMCRQQCHCSTLGVRMGGSKSRHPVPPN